MSEIGIVEDGHGGTLAQDSNDTARLGKVQEVLLSQDILPGIILHLKDSMGTKHWKKAVARLLVVNKAFFHSGIGVLWSSMDNIIPAFKLLPWFSDSKCYSGIGLFDYTGAEDWERFNLYAALIREFDFTSVPPSLNMEQYLSVELMTLPGRPDPFFPHLQHIAINPPATVRLPSIFIFVTPSLRSVDVFPSHRLSTPATGDVSAGQVLHLFDEWLAVFARIAALSIELQHFSYCGATSGRFWSILSRFTYLRSLRLSVKNAEDPESLHVLRCLPLLESLKIDALCLNAYTAYRPCTDVTRARPPNQLHSLQELSIFTTAYHHFRIALSISPPRVRHLHLHYFKDMECHTFSAGVSRYLENSDALETVNVEFSCSHLRGDALESLFGIDRRTAAAKQKLSLALDAVKNVQKMSFIDTPYLLAVVICPVLCQSMARWNALTSFNFQISLDGIQLTSLPLFPGLSFLATTVWKHCRQLQELVIHFNRDMIIRTEDLGELLESALPSISPHPLRELTINTGATLEESKKLELTAQRKVDIAMFFDRLFPKLEVVGGSAVELWNEVDVLVKGFQRQRRYFIAGVEGHLGGIQTSSVA